MFLPGVRGSMILLFVLIVAGCERPASNTGTSAWPSSFAFGREPSADMIQRMDTDVRPDGQGLPEGSGTVTHGRLIYQQKCALCHGRTGTEGPYAVLVTKTDSSALTPASANSEKTIGNYWPYATTLYDYIQRAMPYTSPGSLTTEEVYSLTAYLLYANAIIDSTQVMNATALPKVSMPAKDLFVVDDRRDGPEVR